MINHEDKNEEEQWRGNGGHTRGNDVSLMSIEDFLTFTTCDDDGSERLGNEESSDSVAAFGEGAYAFRPEPKLLARLGFRDFGKPGAPFIGGGIQWLVDQGKKVPSSLAREAAACKGCQSKIGCESFEFCQKSLQMRRETLVLAQAGNIARSDTGHRGHRSV